MQQPKKFHAIIDSSSAFQQTLLTVFYSGKPVRDYVLATAQANFLAGDQ